MGGVNFSPIVAMTRRVRRGILRTNATIHDLKISPHPSLPKRGIYGANGENVPEHYQIRKSIINGFSKLSG